MMLALVKYCSSTYVPEYYYLEIKFEISVHVISQVEENNYKSH